MPLKSAGLPAVEMTGYSSQIPQTDLGPEALTRRRSRNQSNGVETQSAQRLGSRSQRNASASVTSFELRALCDEKSCSENKILRVCNTAFFPGCAGGKAVHYA
jgi:hypothetical protein